MLKLKRPFLVGFHFNENVSFCNIAALSTVVGGWSMWSSWEPCGNTGEPRTGDKCICRRRSCDMPEPRFGGERCQGVSVEVTNCTSEFGRLFVYKLHV